VSGITRRDLFGLAGGTVLRGGLAAPERRPNVLFIMSDDMHVELGCYGSMFHAQTPNLDALAKSGVRFGRNYCQFPSCNPSRSSLLNGRHPTTTGVLGNRTAFRDLHPDWISRPQLFKENSYQTVRIGKIFPYLLWSGALSRTSPERPALIRERLDFRPRKLPLAEFCCLRCRPA
jgi:iduronate 2-sulfatase